MHVAGSIGRHWRKSAAPAIENMLPKFDLVPLVVWNVAECAEINNRQNDDVAFSVQRRRGSRRWDEPWRAYYKQLMRKRIETAFSRLTAMFPRHIHATSFRGFLLKVSFLVIAFALDRAFIQQLGLINR